MPKNVFKVGNPGGPGRPPLIMHLVLARELAKHGYDVGKAVAEAFKAKDWKLINKWRMVFPYLFVELHAKEFDIKPVTPDDSKLTVDQRIEAAKEYEAVKTTPESLGSNEIQSINV